MIFKKMTKGYPGEIKGETIFCPLLNDWIGRIVPCMEICDERGGYLNNKDEQTTLKTAQQFNRAAKHAGFILPQEINNAINVCLFCQAMCQDDSQNVREIPSYEKIDREELLQKLYG